MAAVYGMTSYVPPASTRQPHTATFTPENTSLSPEVRQNLLDSNVVLAVITQAPALNAVAEMKEAAALGKLIPIIGPGVPAEDYEQFDPYFVVDPGDPAQAEKQIVQYLAKKRESQTMKNALIALATLTVALLLFGSLTPDS